LGDGRPDPAVILRAITCSSPVVTGARRVLRNGCDALSVARSPRARHAV